MEYAIRLYISIGLEVARRSWPWALLTVAIYWFGRLAASCTT